MSGVNPNPIRVFISYSWDSDAHKQRVLELANKLRADGIEAWIDRYIAFPSEGWQHWMHHQIDAAQFVIVIATENYAQRFLGNAPVGTGLGVNWEGLIISAQLYQAGGKNEKFLPAAFSQADTAHIPPPLNAFSRFCLEADAGYDELYRLLTGQPAIVAPPVGQRRDLSSAAASPKLAALAIPAVHDHAAEHSNLIRLPYGFFGREEELKKIAGSLAPEARTWGALIDGAGGIGKTSLAICAARQTPLGLFDRIIFLSAKGHELTPDGVKLLRNFVVPSYLEMLNELARQLSQPELAKTPASERARELQQALQNAKALLIFDNLESLTTEDRDQLFDFLAHLPGGCKAIVTSRRRDDIDARVVRIGKLGQDAALNLIQRLAEDRDRLQLTTPAERLQLYEDTGGNPLLIRWVAGQLGRGTCRTIADALKWLKQAPEGEAALEFIFGDIASGFTPTEAKVLAALSHFSTPMEVKFIAELAGLGNTAAQMALEDLTGRALVTGLEENTRFVMTPLVADFLRRARQDEVQQTGNKLCDWAYALAVENGHEKHNRFPKLEAAWPQIAAAWPRLMAGDNARLQTLCDALFPFLTFSGRWDEWLALSRQAEEKAVAAKDFANAGWRVYQRGWGFYLLGQSSEVLACADRAEQHWLASKAGVRERAAAIQLRGLGHRLAENYPAAITAFSQAVELSRSLPLHSADVAIGLNALAGAQHSFKQYDEAETNHREALRIAKLVDDTEGVATYTGNLAYLALSRQDWVEAEKLAREALPLSEKVGRKELIAEDNRRIAQALARQNRKAEGLPYAQKAVDIYTPLRSPDLADALETLKECQS